MAMKVINNQHHMNDIVNDCSSDEQRIVLFESKDGLDIVTLTKQLETKEQSAAQKQRRR